MTIAIGSDHGGYLLKEKIREYLAARGHEIINIGPHNEESVDYPLFAKEVAYLVRDKKATFGVVICSSGVGVCITANKVKGVRAVMCQDEYVASLSREHNNCNVIALGQKIATYEKAIRYVDAFINTPYSQEERHQRRLNQIEILEGCEYENE